MSCVTSPYLNLKRLHLFLLSYFPVSWSLVIWLHITIKMCISHWFLPSSCTTESDRELSSDVPRSENQNSNFIMSKWENKKGTKTHEKNLKVPSRQRQQLEFQLSPCERLKAGRGDDRPCSSRSWNATSCSRLSFFSSRLHCSRRLFLTALLRCSSSQSLRAASKIFIWSANSASTMLSSESCRRTVGL